MIVLTGCGESENADIQGLWQLENINIDGYERPLSRGFVEFKGDGSFAVSQVDGDFLGTYTIKDKTTQLVSNTTSWFNTRWTFFTLDDQLNLKGTELGFRNTKLTFRKINQVPAFDDFENRLMGAWNLYKIYHGDQIKAQRNTQMTFADGTNYSIQEDSIVLEEGLVIIDTRHQKISFEHHETAWRAWFYGDELRLSNDQMGLRYSLRR
ncbi:MAG: hypothetical protein RIF33_06095 [Cyclobacteriaceae bacterium]